MSNLSDDDEGCNDEQGLLRRQSSGGGTNKSAHSIRSTFSNKTEKMKDSLHSFRKFGKDIMLTPKKKINNGVHRNNHSMMLDDDDSIESSLNSEDKDLLLTPHLRQDNSGHQSGGMASKMFGRRNSMGCSVRIVTNSTTSTLRSFGRRSSLDSAAITHRKQQQMVVDVSAIAANNMEGISPCRRNGRRASLQNTSLCSSLVSLPMADSSPKKVAATGNKQFGRRESTFVGSGRQLERRGSLASLASVDSSYSVDYGCIQFEPALEQSIQSELRCDNSSTHTREFTSSSASPSTLLLELALSQLDQSDCSKQSSSSYSLEMGEALGKLEQVDQSNRRKDTKKSTSSRSLELGDVLNQIDQHSPSNKSKWRESDRSIHSEPSLMRSHVGKDGEVKHRRKPKAKQKNKRSSRIESNGMTIDASTTTTKESRRRPKKSVSNDSAPKEPKKSLSAAAASNRRKKDGGDDESSKKPKKSLSKNKNDIDDENASSKKTNKSSKKNTKTLSTTAKKGNKYGDDESKKSRKKKKVRKQTDDDEDTKNKGDADKMSNSSRKRSRPPKPKPKHTSRRSSM